MTSSLVRPPSRLRRVWTALLLALLVVVVGGLGTGALSIAPFDVARVLLSSVGLVEGEPASRAMSAVVVDIRLPRVLLALIVGGGLSLAGAVLQGLFRNPLADPALIGVSTGAAFAVAAGIVLQQAVPVLAVLGHVLSPMAACAGGVVAIVVVMALSRRSGTTQMGTLLLAGVAINALSAAGLGFLLFIADDAQLRDITFWMLGSLSGATWSSVAVTVPVVVVCGAGLQRMAPVLDAMCLGESAAGHLGIRVEQAKRICILLSAVVVGATVSTCGAIGFVGLVVPHLWRLWIGPQHQRLLPGATVLGAVLLLAADVIARSAFAPAEMPVGIVTSLLGAPFFLWLLSRRRGVV